MKKIKQASNFLLLKILTPILIIYLLLGLFLFLNQKNMIYYPNSQDFYECQGFLEYEKHNHNGTRFYYKPTNPDNVIVYYHGNAGSACDRSYYKQYFENSNSSLIFVEYTGYSKDNLKPSKDLILKDVENIIHFISNNSFQHITVYGQSIGSGPASYHASISTVNRLILVTPFTRLSDVVQSKYKIYPSSLLLRENYDNTNWLKDYNQKLLIIHGNKDNIIPHKFSEELFNQIKTQDKEYLLIKHKNHNNLWTSSIFKNKITHFLNN